MGSSIQKDRPMEAAHLLWEMAPQGLQKDQISELSTLPFPIFWWNLPVFASGVGTVGKQGSLRSSLE